MKFKRTTKFNPDNLSAKVHKNWLSEDKQFRIYWRRQAWGIAVPGAYFALRWQGGWNFATDRRPYRTFKKAINECTKALEQNDGPSKRTHRTQDTKKRRSKKGY